MPIQTGQQILASEVLDALPTYTELEPVSHSATNPDGWEDWDLSGSCPANTKHVDIQIKYQGVASANAGVRKNGSALNRVLPMTGTSSSITLMRCEVDVNRVIEVFVQGATNRATFYLTGYSLTDAP